MTEAEIREYLGNNLSLEKEVTPEGVVITLVLAYDVISAVEVTLEDVHPVARPPATPAYPHPYQARYR